MRFYVILARGREGEGGIVYCNPCTNNVLDIPMLEWIFPGINIKFPTLCSVGGWVFVVDVTGA